MGKKLTWQEHLEKAEEALEELDNCNSAEVWIAVSTKAIAHATIAKVLAEHGR